MKACAGVFATANWPALGYWLVCDGHGELIESALKYCGLVRHCGLIESALGHCGLIAPALACCWLVCQEPLLESALA